MIYEPAEDSYLLAEQVKKFAFGKVLDVGTGSGILAETSASLEKVRSVLAADVSDEVILFLKKKIKKEIKKNKNLKKIKIIKSNLFSKTKSKFDTIIFNPPYLPFDVREPIDSRLATTGGKRGHEILERFLLQVNDYLTEKGIALILFSSLTNKEKVEEIIENIGYDFEKISELKISFETLYVYKIQRNSLLRDLFGKKIKKIIKFASGKRGEVFVGYLGSKKIAVKVQRKDVKTETINKEADLLVKLNEKGIGPKFLFSGKNHFAYEFAEGEAIEEYVKKCTRKEAVKVFVEVLKQCRILDEMSITKEEMTNPYKHIIVGKKIVLIDFERAHYDLTPGNVTQFCQYIMKNLKLNELIKLGKEYKQNPSEENYSKIINLLSS